MAYKRHLPWAKPAQPSFYINRCRSDLRHKESRRNN
jgi:hypothetical protein